MSLLVQNAQIVPAIIPIDLATANNDGDWVNMENYQHCAVIFMADVGTAAQDPIFTVRQATSNAGAGAKALTFTDIWEKEGATAINAIGVMTHRTQAAANTYTSATGGENEQLIVVEFDAIDLDVANDFTHIQLQIPDTGATAGKFGMGLYILTEPRYPQDINVTAID